MILILNKLASAVSGIEVFFNRYFVQQYSKYQQVIVEVNEVYKNAFHIKQFSRRATYEMLNR